MRFPSQPPGPVAAFAGQCHAAGLLTARTSGLGRKLTRFPVCGKENQGGFVTVIDPIPIVLVDVCSWKDLNITTNTIGSFWGDSHFWTQPMSRRGDPKTES